MSDRLLLTIEMEVVVKDATALVAAAVAEYETSRPLNLTDEQASHFYTEMADRPGLALGVLMRNPGVLVASIPGVECPGSTVAQRDIAEGEPLAWIRPSSIQGTPDG